METIRKVKFKFKKTSGKITMDTKLTLKLKDDFIWRAKKYVSSIGTSGRSLSGIIKLDENYDYKSHSAPRKNRNNCKTKSK